jgi:hypothetical protein
MRVSSGEDGREWRVRVLYTQTRPFRRKCFVGGSPLRGVFLDTARSVVESHAVGAVSRPPRLGQRARVFLHFVPEVCRGSALHVFRQLSRILRPLRRVILPAATPESFDADERLLEGRGLFGGELGVRGLNRFPQRAVFGSPFSSLTRIPR